MEQIKTLKKFQQVIDDWIQNHGGYWPPLSMLASIIEEVGEISRELNHLEGYKPKKSKEKDSDIGEELADLLFSLICLANHYKIDLSEELEQVIEKFTSRDSDRFKK